MLPESTDIPLDSPVDSNTHSRPNGKETTMNRMLVMLVSIGLILTAGAIQAEDYMNEPEGIVFDSANNRYLVANWADGSIVQIDATYGMRGYFKTGLGNCSGIYIAGNAVFVACNNRFLRGFDLTTGEQLADLYLTTTGLFGLTSDTSGYLYAADWGGNKVYQVDLSDYSTTTFLSGGVFKPIGLLFEPEKNRILVAAMADGWPIKSINLPKPNVTDVADHDMGALSSITRDSRGSYFLSTAGIGYKTVYRCDSLFAEPPEIILDGIGGITTVSYNSRDEILGVVTGTNNTCILKEMLVSFDADIRLGWPALEVNFTGESDSSITDWLWSFGDGETAVGPTPIHTYAEAGVYDVTLEAVTAADDTLRRTKQSFISVLADSLIADSSLVEPTDTLAELTVKITNFGPLTEVHIPIEYGGDIDLTYVGCSVEGCSFEGIGETSIAHNDPAGKLLTLRVRTDGYDYLPPGSWIALKVSFEAHNLPMNGGIAPITIDGYSVREPAFFGPFDSYRPEVVNGALVFLSCCVLRGDVDHSGEINISDITSYVDYIFGTGSLVCVPEADVDGSEQTDISDLTFLVEYLFGGGPPPPEC
jgi:PKD repeat protein